MVLVIEAANDYSKENPPDFITHLNYVSYLNTVSKNLTLNYSNSVIKPIDDIKILTNKINMIELTLRGLEGEYQTILKFPEYSTVCVSWISVKTYYVLFNLCLILKYLITGNKNAFISSHEGILNEFKGHIERKTLYFSEDKFNMLISCKTMLKWKTQSGANIKRSNVDPAERYLQILKKLTNYAVDEYKRRMKIDNLHTKKSRTLLNNYLEHRKVNMCEFFYWYRIKANYRDLEYLNKDIDDAKFKEYYINYYELTCNFVNAFKSVINDLSKIRLSKKIF